MTKKQIWNRLRRERRRNAQARDEYTLELYLLHRSIRPLAPARTPGFTDKGYLKRRVDQPLEYTNGCLLAAAGR